MTQQQNLRASSLKTINGNSLVGSGDIAISSSSPAGANTQIQYNNNGVFGANSGLSWDGNLQVGTGTANAKIWVQNDNASNPIAKFIGTTGKTVSITNTGGLTIPSGGTTSGSAPLKLTTQASPLSTPEQGVLELIGNSLQFTQLGNRKGIVMSNSVLLSDFTWGNFSGESSAVLTYQREANYFEVGKCEEIVLRGVIQQASGGNLTVRVKYGGSTLHTIVSTTGSVLTATAFEIRINSTIRSIGANGSIQFNSIFRIENLTQTGYASGLSSINTTASQNMTITLQWNTANTGNTITVHQGRVLCIEPNR